MPAKSASLKYPHLMDIFKSEFIYVSISLLITLIGIALMLIMGPRWEMTILNSATLLVGLIVKPVLIVGLCYYFLCKKGQKSLIEGFSLFLPRLKTFSLSVLAALVCIIIPNLFVHIFPSMATAMGKDSATIFTELLSSPIGLTLVVIAALIAPFYEELFFRQFVYTKLLNQYNALIAVSVVTFWFFAAHVLQYWGNLLAILIILSLSLMLTLMRHYSKSLVPSIVAHFVYNLVVVMALVGGI
jgi:hypothetical protein